MIHGHRVVVGHGHGHGDDMAPPRKDNTRKISSGARDQMQAQESLPLLFCTHTSKSKDADWTNEDMSRHCADNWLIPRSVTPVHESEKEPCPDVQTSVPFWLLMCSSRFSCESDSLS